MQDIREYWDGRAIEAAGAPSATTNDVYLRDLESTVIIEQLKFILQGSDRRVLDVGCGDGQTTINLAGHFPNASFLGVDISSEMIASAKKKASQSIAGLKMDFTVGDARFLRDTVGNAKFDIILTNRCLINIVDRNQQYVALKQVAECLCPSGFYFGTENFLGGQRNLNEMRKSIALPEIAIRWHNLYFDEQEFQNQARSVFRSVELINFSSAYYFVTRCLYSALCKQENLPVDYKHPLHRVALKVPTFGDFSPIKLIRAQL
jgi:ubiquinone/menaquinone biosynthesis C-methylase UbiE